MKYNTKTAVHVTDEFTRQNIIEFFEAIKSDCNDGIWKERDIEIGEYWNLTNAGLLNYRDNLDEYDFTGYTIINGIPENWREEMETPESDLQSKINQLETEKKELKELIESLLKWDKKYPKSKTYSISEGKIVDNELSEIITQAKQLLNK